MSELEKEEIDGGFLVDPPLIPIEPPQEITLLNYFRLYFDEFKEDIYNDQKITLYLNLAKNFVNKDVWGDSYKYGVSLLTAHLLIKKAQRTTVDGSINFDNGKKVSSKTVGSVSISFDTSTGKDGLLSSLSETSYGQEFLDLSNLYGSFVIQL